MKHILAVALGVFLLFGQASAAGLQDAKSDSRGQKEKLSYSLGYDMGARSRKSSMDLDRDIVIKAFSDGLAGSKAAMTDQEMRETLSELQKEMKARQAGKKKDMVESQKQFSENNRQEGEIFLSENAKKEGVVTLPDGLQYKIIKSGAGRQPGKADTVKIHYRGTLVNGTEFDSSFKRGKPATFGVGNVIKGWAEALQLMKEGSEWMIYIPSELAYGQRGAGRGKIGPNQTLIFDVELISVNPKNAVNLSKFQEKNLLSY